MAQSEQVKMSEIEVYESICLLSEEMLRHAKSSDWDQIVLIEMQRRPLIDDARGMSKNKSIKNNESVHKMDLIQRILSADSEAKLWVKERMQLLKNGFKTERKLLETYGSYATA